MHHAEFQEFERLFLVLIRINQLNIFQWLGDTYIRITFMTVWKNKNLTQSLENHDVLICDGSNYVWCSIVQSQKIGCSSLITKRWICSSLFDVRKNYVQVRSIGELIDLAKALLGSMFDIHYTFDSSLVSIWFHEKSTYRNASWYTQRWKSGNLLPRLLWKISDITLFFKKFHHWLFSGDISKRE